MALDFSIIELYDKEFQRISKLVNDIAGIYLPPTKTGLVKSRLTKRLRNLKLTSFHDYLDFIQHDKSGIELDNMIDIITTNKTNFFREIQHFNFFRDHILPELIPGNNPIRIWSAGCSSGAEPYSLSILLHEEIMNIERKDVKILCTDISRQMLNIAKEGIYEESIVKEMELAFINKYFHKININDQTLYKIVPKIQTLTKFANLNLMDDWPMKGPFQLIMCRNVMIYFNKETRHKLIQRFYDKLANNGYLFVGHSESLVTTEHNLTYIQPAVYQKRI